MSTEERFRAEWLEWRRHGVGASDVAAIIGVSPYASAFSVWAEKAGLTSGPEESEVMEAGRWLELAIGPWFAHRTGLHVAEAQRQCVHPEHEWMRCTADGFVFDYSLSDGWDIADALGLLEIKTSAGWAKWEAVPLHYQTQGQWAMAVTGAAQVWFAVLHARRLGIYELPRNQADIDYLTEAASVFWHDHVLTGVPPDVDGSDATLATLKEMYPRHREGALAPLDDVQAAVTGLRAAREDKAAAEKAEKACKAIIAATMADAEEGTIGGVRVVTYRAQESRRLDAEALRARLPRVAERFTRTTTARIMRTPTPPVTPQPKEPAQ